MQHHRIIWLAFGANVDGAWGAPMQSIAQAVRELAKLGLVPVAMSDIIVSAPQGVLRQPEFCNAVGAFSGSIGAMTLLRQIKRLERAAGRRIGRRHGPRPLDIDIIDFGRRRVRERCPSTGHFTLVLPHPGALHRGFVLEPLATIAPHWRHPLAGVTASSLLRRKPWLARDLSRVRAARRRLRRASAIWAD